MDASRRSSHVYGKTQAGKNALHAARGALSSATRQLLILIDGRRTLEDLSGILGDESLERSLDELEVLGYVEIVRHFPDDDDQTPVEVAPPLPLKLLAEATHSAPRQRSAMLILLAILAAIIGIAWLLVRGIIESTGPHVVARPLVPTAPPASVADTPNAAPAAKAPEHSPSPPGADRPRTPASTADRAPTASKPEPKPAAPRQAARPGPDAAAAPPPEPSAAPASAPPVLHVRSQVTPQIPQQAKDLGIKSGHIVVTLLVKPDGTVDRVELVSATAPQMYDQEMQQTFEKWTFDPTAGGGRMTVQVDIVPHGEDAAPSEPAAAEPQQ